LSDSVVPITSERAGSTTVIIPVYNGERFIRRALDSVLNQTEPPAQIIVVDDGSKDPTREIVTTEYSGRVTLVCQTNGGPAKARNAGLRLATGEFVAFLDADDFWEPLKLATQVKTLEKHPDAVGNYTGLRLVDDAGVFLRDSLPVDVATMRSSLRWCNPGVPPSSVLLRRSVLDKVGGFNERQLGSEDWDLWFRLVESGSFCVCSDPLTDYRMSSSGLSGNADHMFNDFMKMVDDVLLTGLTGVRRVLWRRRIISYQEFKACLTARGAGDKAKEWDYIKRSVLTWPFPFWAPERFKSFAVTFLRRVGLR
jgi:glycosyltransferase involved in cell wall biosynthesis